MERNIPNLVTADNGYPYKYSGIDRKPEEWSVSVTEMKKEVESAVREFVRSDHPSLNACLGNRYNDGKDNIGAHSDSEGNLDPMHSSCLYLWEHPGSLFSLAKRRRKR